jgi:hypothetical protein
VSWLIGAVVVAGALGAVAGYYAAAIVTNAEALAAFYGHDDW